MRKKDPVCPYIGKPCLEQGCTMYVHITGQNPQTGAQMDLWDCAIKWTPVMMLDAAKNMRGVQAAVETMRNDVVERQDSLNGTIALAAQAAQASRLGARPVKAIGDDGDDSRC
ncbi:hypothetical protein [Paraburkholderia tropica]|uniref:hypothetical protein n=1 Tax=Paraburkholderia tropica TaxID=92647 RepID=UPI003D2745A1